LSRRSLFFVAGLALVIAACGDDDVADTTSTTIGPTTTVAPSTTEAPTTTTVPPTTTTSAATTTSESEPDTNDLAQGSGCTPGGGPLPDGEWFGLVTSRGDDSIEFDLACWFTGDGAVQASAEDGEESPPPNDYYVRNANPEIREVPVAPGAEVVFYPDGDPTNEEVLAYADWAARVDQRGYELGVWLEVEEGSITAILEQWVP
jgi:hypothetical protein